MQDLELTTGLLRMAYQADARASFFPSWDREVNRRDAVVEWPEGEISTKLEQDGWANAAKPLQLSPGRLLTKRQTVP